MSVASIQPTIRERLPARVLVVDDEPTICSIVVRILEHWGYLVSTAHTAAEALEHLRERRFEVALVDLHLGPDDGRDLIRQMKGGPRAPKVIALTGDIDATAGGAVDGAVAMCAKPFSMTELVEIVHAQVRAGRNRGARP